MTNSCCCDNLPVCILHLGENGLEEYRLAKKWEQFKIVLLFMDHPVARAGDRAMSILHKLKSVYLPIVW